MVLGWNSGQGWQMQKSSWQWKIWQWRLKTVAHAEVTWLMFNIRLWLFFQGSLTASLSIPPHAIKVHKFFFYFVYFLSDTLFQELPLCCVAPGIFFGSLCPCPSQVSSFLLLLFPFTYAHSHFWGPVTPSLLFPSPMPHPHHYWCTHDNHPLLAPTSACCTPGHVEAPATAPICPVSLFFCFCFAFTHSSPSALLVLFPCAASPDAPHTTSSPPASSAMSTQPASCAVCQCPGPHFYYRL